MHAGHRSFIQRIEVPVDLHQEETTYGPLDVAEQGFDRGMLHDKKNR